MDERDVLQCVTEMARRIGAQDWSGLAALYDPGYRGRRGLVRYQSAEEEITRLREETSAVGPTLKSYELTPRLLTIGRSMAHLSVVERMELAWEDGCRRIARRQFEQYWQHREGGWRLKSTEGLRGSERVEEEAALLPHVGELLRIAQRWLRLRTAFPFSAGTPTGVIGLCGFLALPPRLTVAVETRELPHYASEALRRACRAAIETWNQSLYDIVELIEHAEFDRPDLLIRGWNRPIYGRTLGFAFFTPVMRPARRKARLAELRISVFERTRQRALCLSPAELFVTVCHELGHCFGLDECTHPGRVMAPLGRTDPLPQGPFRVERRTIVRWQQTAHSLLAQAYQRLGQRSEADAASARAAAMKAEIPSELGLLPHPRHLLVDTSYAPTLLQHYWNGCADARYDHSDVALACFEQLLNEEMHPELLLRRGLVQPSVEERLADFRRAVELDPHWNEAHENLLALLVYLGPSDEEVVERERVRPLRWRAEIEKQLFIARTSSRPWEVVTALLLAAALSMRLSGATMQSHLHRCSRSWE